MFPLCCALLGGANLGRHAQKLAERGQHQLRGRLSAFKRWENLSA